MVLMTSKTSLQKWSGVFLFPSVSPVFFQIGTVTYQHRLCFRWRRFMYEFLPLIRKARTRCDLTGFHLAARSAQVLSLGRLACWRSSRPGARGLSARFHTLSCRTLHDFARLRLHHNSYPPETTAGGSVFREAVSKTLPASASDQRNAFPEVIKIPESKATAFQTLDSAVYSFNRTVGEIILDAVKNSCHVLLQGGDSCVYVLTRTTVVFQNINEPLPCHVQDASLQLMRKCVTFFDNASLCTPCLQNQSPHNVSATICYR